MPSSNVTDLAHLYFLWHLRSAWVYFWHWRVAEDGKEKMTKGKKEEITIYLSNEHIIPRDSNELLLNLIIQFDWVRGQCSFSLRAKTIMIWKASAPPYLLLQASRVFKYGDTLKSQTSWISTSILGGDWMGKREQSMAPGKCKWHLKYGFTP